MMTTNPEETQAAWQTRATGLSVAALGALCTVIGLILPFVFDLSDPMSPAIGASGLLFGGVLFVALGSYMVMSARTAA